MAPSTIKAVLDRAHGIIDSRKFNCMSNSRGQPAGNPSARAAQQQAARRAQINNERNRQQQPTPVKAEPAKDENDSE